LGSNSFIGEAPMKRADLRLVEATVLPETGRTAKVRCPATSRKFKSFGRLV
jgi:hypothetical protein